MAASGSNFLPVSPLDKVAPWKCHTNSASRNTTKLARGTIEKEMLTLLPDSCKLLSLAFQVNSHSIFFINNRGCTLKIWCISVFSFLSSFAACLQIWVSKEVNIWELSWAPLWKEENTLLPFCRIEHLTPLPSKEILAHFNGKELF